MPAFSNTLPLWISILFLIVIPAPMLLMAALARKAALRDPELSKRALSIALGTLAFYALYMLYVTLMSGQGLFSEVSLPPKILKYTMFPLLAFLLLVVFNLPVYKKLLHLVHLHELVQLQIFRLIGSFFIVLYAFSMLPKSIGLIAGIGDLITALSSIYIASALKKKTANARKLALAWNTFGMLDIVATSASALILTKISIDTGAQGVEGLAQFPFCFIPAFAPATILFLHFSIYRKLYWERSR